MRYLYYQNIEDKKLKKTAIIVNELNIIGGTHKQVLRLSEYFEKQKISFGIYTKTYEQKMTYDGFSKFEINVRKKDKDYKNNVVGKLWRRISEIRNDLIFIKQIAGECDAINIHDNGLWFYIFCFKVIYHKPVIWQINDLPGAFVVGNWKYKNDNIRKSINRKIYRYLAKRVDAITVNVTKNKERVEALMHKSAYVFYCGTDINPNLKFHSNIQDRKELHLLSCGVFFPYRNYETLVDVVYELHQRGIKAKMDIIGSTDLDKGYAEKITNLIKKKELTGAITVRGQVSADVYNLLFNQADIFLFTNIDQSWGLAVFEAMSCGLPVIVSNSVGAIELLYQGIDSIIVDPMATNEITEIIEELMENTEYYSKISKNAAKSVANFTWEKLYCEKMSNLINQVVNGYEYV